MKFNLLFIMSFLLMTNVSEAAFISIDKNILSLERANLKIGQKINIKSLDFKEDTAIIKKESSAVLNELYDFLNLNQDIKIQLGGHTNGIPSHEYCQKLSAERAEAVANYLINKGIGVDRISTKAYGKSQPIAANTTPEGRKKNQRVDIEIIDMD